MFIEYKFYQNCKKNRTKPNNRAKRKLQIVIKIAKNNPRKIASSSACLRIHNRMRISFRNNFQQQQQKKRVDEFDGFIIKILTYT